MKKISIFFIFIFLFAILFCSPYPKIKKHYDNGEINKLCDFTYHNDIYVRKFSLKRLGYLKSNKIATDCLIKNLQNSDPSVTEIILDGLTGRLNQYNLIFEELEKYLDYKSSYELPQIIKFIADNNKSPSKELIQKLKRLESDSNTNISLSSSYALIQYNEIIDYSSIEKGLRSDFILTKRKAARLIEYLPNDDRKMYLVSFLSDQEDNELKGIYSSLQKKHFQPKINLVKDDNLSNTYETRVEIKSSECTVAVYQLNSAGVSEIICKILTDKIRNGLVNSRICKIIEKEKMNEILEEQSFQLTGCTDDQCLVQVGRIMGVRFIIAGTFGKVNNIYTLIIRTIDVESSEILKSSDYNWTCDINEIITKRYLEVIQNLF